MNENQKESVGIYEIFNLPLNEVLAVLTPLNTPTGKFSTSQCSTMA
jgi:hypothetical protein